MPLPKISFSKIQANNSSDYLKELSEYGNYFRKFFPYFGDTTKIYLDSAATSQKPGSVILAQMEFLVKHNSNIHRTTGGKSTSIIEEVRQKTATFLGVDSSEIVFGGGFTELLCNMAMSLAESLRPGDVILLSQWEHHSNLLIWQKIAQQKNCSIEYIPIHKPAENQTRSQIHIAEKDWETLLLFASENSQKQNQKISIESGEEATEESTVSNLNNFKNSEFRDSLPFSADFLDIKKADLEISQKILDHLSQESQSSREYLNVDYHDLKKTHNSKKVENRPKNDSVKKNLVGEYKEKSLDNSLKKLVDNYDKSLTGSINWLEFIDILIIHKNRIKIFSVSETSNISGYNPPIREIIKIVKTFSKDCICIVDTSQSSKG